MLAALLFAVGLLVPPMPLPPGFYRAYEGNGVRCLCDRVMRGEFTLYLNEGVPMAAREALAATCAAWCREAAR